MRRTMTLLAAGAIALAPAAVLADPGSPNGQATGWDHLNGPAPGSTGQPGASCEVTDTRPGNAQFAPGSAFNPEGNSGSHYAGEQPQNQRNNSSVSQYDVACLNQTLHH